MKVTPPAGVRGSRCGQCRGAVVHPPACPSPGPASWPSCSGSGSEGRCPACCAVPPRAERNLWQRCPVLRAADHPQPSPLLHMFLSGHAAASSLPQETPAGVRLPPLVCAPLPGPPLSSASCLLPHWSSGSVPGESLSPSPAYRAPRTGRRQLPSAAPGLSQRPGRMQAGPDSPRPPEGAARTAPSSLS